MDENNEKIEGEVLDEREMLKQRARLLGIDFSNNIGTDTLRERIADKLAGNEPAKTDPSVVNPLGAPEDLDMSPQGIRKRIHAEQLKLVRIRVTCMDPKKADLPGEIFTVANEYLGTVSKFVPFGEMTDNGYHVPFCIYTMMNDRKFLNIRTTKDKKTGAPQVHTSMAKEFAIEVLPQLTPEELKQLATAQIAAGSVSNPDIEQI